MSTHQFPEVMLTDKLLGMAAPYNPREMLSFDFEMLKHSLKEYGLVQAIVCNKRSREQGWPEGAEPIIVGGHQRVRAASEIGLRDLGVRWIDVDEVKERQLNLILNRTSGDWEEDSLERALREIEELGGGDALDFTGFSTDELEHYLGTPDGTIAGEGDSFAEPSEDANHECPKCGYRWNE